MVVVLLMMLMMLLSDGSAHSLSVSASTDPASLSSLAAFAHAELIPGTIRLHQRFWHTREAKGGFQGSSICVLSPFQIRCCFGRRTGDSTRCCSARSSNLPSYKRPWCLRGGGRVEFPGSALRAHGGEMDTFKQQDCGRSPAQAVDTKGAPSSLTEKQRQEALKLITPEVVKNASLSD